MNEGALEMLHDSVARLFLDHVDSTRIIAAERGEWCAELWSSVAGLGMDRPHDIGAGAQAWEEASVIVRAAGRYCVPLPLAETILASWLLQQAGLDAPVGPLTVVDGFDRDKPIAERVPWARHARAVVYVRPVADGTEVGWFDLREVPFLAGHNLAREPRDTIDLRDRVAAAAATTRLRADIVRLYGAMLRAGLMAGSLDALLDLSVGYAAERVQFGRPLSQFQAIQQELAKLAGLVAQAGVAARAAFAAAQRWDGATEDGDPTFEIAVAKVIAGEAAEMAPRIAHQVHGAIGFTYEHSLHFATRRLWSWRAEFGGATQWSELLGKMAYARGADGVWPMLTGR